MPRCKSQWHGKTLKPKRLKDQVIRQNVDAMHLRAGCIRHELMAIDHREQLEGGGGGGPRSTSSAISNPNPGTSRQLLVCADFV